MYKRKQKVPVSKNKKINAGCAKYLELITGKILWHCLKFITMIFAILNITWYDYNEIYLVCTKNVWIIYE